MKIFLNSLFSLLLAVVTAGCSSHGGFRESRSQLETESAQALDHLYQSTPGASALAKQAVAVLVFPSIVEGGFIFGGAYGDGVLYEGGAISGYYNSASASFGFLAGLNKFGYALFFMSQDDLKYLKASEGWELGVTPNLTLVDQGVAASFSSTTARKGVYAFFFQQRGLMADVSFKGTKITKIDQQN